jgi:GNAT superfamily N-acetyltransferase
MVSDGATVVRAIRHEEMPQFAHLATGLGRVSAGADHIGFIALGGWYDGQPAGLFLGSFYKEREYSCVMRVLTLRVRERYRSRGMGKALLAQAEADAVVAGCESMEVLLADGSPEVAAAHALAARAGWTRVSLAYTYYKIPWHGICNSHWVTEARPWPENFEVFPWCDVTENERNWLMERRDDPFHFDPALDPFQIGSLPTKNSVGLRVNGQIAGWAVSACLGPDPPDCRTMRGTRLFVRGDLQRRGYGAMLLAEHIQRCPQAGIDYSIFTVSSKERLMLRLLNKHLRPYISHAREVWEWRKVLSPTCALAGVLGSGTYVERDSSGAQYY